MVDSTEDMREIKFRAWDKVNKEMTLSMPLVMVAGFLAAQKEKGADMSRFEWIEYTGLKDKNGKEIYGNDLVIWYGQENPVEIKWSETQQGWVPFINSSTEVIGNIYENSELLKE